MSEERQTNYTIMEGYELPSRGKIYNVPVNPHVELRSMTARDEMKRLSPSTTQFKTLADIIEGCMIEKPAVHVYDMALKDYEFLLHKLRIVTYGDEYKTTVKCPYCDSTHDIIMHLEDLELVDFDEEIYENYRTVKLPKSGDTITLKFQTPRILDETEAKVRELKRRFKDADIQFDTLAGVSLLIDTVNGKKLESTKLDSYLEKLPAMDLVKLLNTISQMNSFFGLNTAVTLDCPQCGGEIRTFFRTGPEFFRPSNI